MADPFDKFLEELSLREQQKLLDSEGLLSEDVVDNSQEETLMDIVDVASEDRILRYTQSFADQFSRKHVKKACRRHPRLIVNTDFGKEVLIGTPDQYGSLIYPSPHLTLEGLLYFIQEMQGQWILVPKNGYLVTWKPRNWSMIDIELYPVLDDIEIMLKAYPSKSLFNLHQLVIEALGLYMIRMPYTEE